MRNGRQMAVISAAARPEQTRESMRELAVELHAMSQPMTALLCRLEIGSMTGTLDGYAEAVREGLVECDRLMRSIAAMRTTIGRALEGP